MCDKFKKISRKTPYIGKTISLVDMNFMKKKRLVTSIGVVTIFAIELTNVMASNYTEPKKEDDEKGECTSFLSSGVVKGSDYMMKLSECLDEEKLSIFTQMYSKFSEEESYVKLYSAIYSLDYKQVYEILSKMTNDFTEENYLKHNIIGDSALKDRIIVCDNKEMAILIAVRSIFYFPEKYGVTRDALDTKEEYISDLDYSHQIGYFSKVVGVDPVLNYAICQTESGFRSKMFLEKHNPSGIRFHEEFEAFPSASAGFIEQALELLKHQIDGRNTIAEIGSFHDPGNEKWVEVVSQVYVETLGQYNELFVIENGYQKKYL